MEEKKKKGRDFPGRAGGKKRLYFAAREHGKFDADNFNLIYN